MKDNKLKVYVDGCSYTAAAGLSSDFKLANLLGADYDVSYEGKSNLSMFKDLHENILNYDTFVVNLTTADRFQLFEDDVCVPVLPNYNKAGRFVGTVMEDLYPIFHKVLFARHNSKYYSQVSDAIADSIILLLEKHNKKYVISSWEQRNGIYADKINLLDFNNSLKIPNDGHLNENGMTLWAQQIMRMLND